jgi:hypothetical protein
MSLTESSGDRRPGVIALVCGVGATDADDPVRVRHNRVGRHASAVPAYPSDVIQNAALRARGMGSALRARRPSRRLLPSTP